MTIYKLDEIPVVEETHSNSPIYLIQPNTDDTPHVTPSHLLGPNLDTTSLHVGRTWRSRGYKLKIRSDHERGSALRTLRRTNNPQSIFSFLNPGSSDDLILFGGDIDASVTQAEDLSPRAIRLHIDRALSDTIIISRHQLCNVLPELQLSGDLLAVPGRNPEDWHLIPNTEIHFDELVDRIRREAGVRAWLIKPTEESPQQPSA